jgi:predicted naringenin-chalcone synthase
MSFVIRGVGTALPDHTISQSDAAEVAKVFCGRSARHSGLLATLYRQTGIASRHTIFDDRFVRDVLDGTHATQCVFLPTGHSDDRGPSTGQRMRRYAAEALPLARRASELALRESGFAPDTITHLVTVSCTGFAAPGVDLGLIQDLALPFTVERTHVGFMGCHGALNGLRLAQAFADAQPGARILLCAVELCTLHLFYGWDPKKLVVNALFADGAAAAVGCAGAMTNPEWKVAAAASRLFPDSQDAMTWDIGDHGFEMTLSTRVPALIAEQLRPWLEGWLGAIGIDVEDVPSWAVHPGGPRILSAVEQGLRLSSQALTASREVLAECGNMSSPTLLFILERLRARQAPRPCVALGFGPGLAAEAVLFR